MVTSTAQDSTSGVRHTNALGAVLTDGEWFR